MPSNLYTSQGTLVALGQRLGGGGEGEVFAVANLSGSAAKIYAKPLDAAKQDKLRFMASAADARLLSYVAWPQDTLHSGRGGPVTGFLMRQVLSSKPVHMVYSPAHRRQDSPKLAWDFLLFAARNMAASFETVHAHGHIVGDVNQDSFLVAPDSRVVLVDSDSFQIGARGKVHLCEVGVGHFTAPELQTLKSFHGFKRTTNHDNFGLALLLFHMLFGGRHPYSGVPLKAGVGDALEKDIQAFRYAYARDHQMRGLTPPPRSIPVSMLPDAVEAMFSLAFTEAGAQANARPTSQQWVSALDAVRGHLKACAASRMHIYPDHLHKCPWCTLEGQGVVYFIDLGATVRVTPSGFVLAQAWALIEAVQAPPPVRPPLPSDFTVCAEPLAFSDSGQAAAVVYKILAVVVTLGMLVMVPGLWYLALIAGGLIWNAGSTNPHAEERAAERVKRQVALDAARRGYDAIVARAQREAGPEAFIARKADLIERRRELEALVQTERTELDKLHAGALERQKQKYLEQFFIDSATIAGVGPTRKAALRSFGIETAADVSRLQVMQVRGFGEGLTRAVVDWRQRCERGFQFNPAAAVSAADRDAVRMRIAGRRANLESALALAPGQLQELQRRAAAQLLTIKPQLDAAACKVAQTRADRELL